MNINCSGLYSSTEVYNKNIKSSINALRMEVWECKGQNRELKMVHVSNKGPLPGVTLRNKVFMS